MKTYTQLSFEERFVIETLYRGHVTIRDIADFLKRSPNTISRELKKNVVNGSYIAVSAAQKVSARRWRSKEQCLKVGVNGFLACFVEERLKKTVSVEPSTDQ
jgi:IS30 family transposase